MSISSKVCLVTGASSGIGAAVSLALAKQGAKLALVGRDKSRLESVKEKVVAEGTEAIALVADVVDRTAVKSLVEQVEKELGNVEVLVNNAGLSVWQYMVNCDQDSWDR